MVVFDIQKARSRSIAAISDLDRRHLSSYIHVTTFVLLRAHNTHARTCLRERLSSRLALQSRLSLHKNISETSIIIIKIIKNEVGCRGDTMPKPVYRYKKALQGGVRACNNLTQPNPYVFNFGGCRRLLQALTPPHSAFLYLQFLAWFHPYILLHFYTCIIHSSVRMWLLKEYIAGAHACRS